MTKRNCGFQILSTDTWSIDPLPIKMTSNSLKNKCDIDLSIHRSHNNQLQGIIQQQPNGPLFQKRNDGTVVYVPKMVKETKTDHDRDKGLSKPSGDVREIVEMYTNEPRSNPGSLTDSQPVIVYGTATEKFINVSSVHGNVSMYENSVTANDARKTSTQFSHNQGEANFVSLKTATSTTQALIDDTSGSIPKVQPSIFSSDSENITSLEQDIAQTLIQINPMSRLHPDKQGKP